MSKRAEIVLTRLYAERRAKQPLSEGGRVTQWDVYEPQTHPHFRFGRYLLHLFPDGEFRATRLRAGVVGKTSRSFARLLSILTMGG